MNIVLEYITPNAEELIGKYAAICYDADISSEACLRRTKACVSRGHLATLRFAHATFFVEGVSRICTHQFVRSKHLDFLQESQRYVKQESPTYIYPGTSLDEKISGLYQRAQRVYEDLLEAGVRKEDARYVLPAGIGSSMYVTGNFQAWLDFIRLRSGKEAQKEIRMVAHEICKTLYEEAPNVFKEEYEKVMSS